MSRVPQSTQSAQRLWAHTLALASCALAAMQARAADPPPSTTPTAALESVVVSAKKLNVETRIDRKVFTVADDALTAFGTASDILNVIPSVDVDADGVVSLRGDSNVLVLIDGKPSTQFQGSAAGENLQALAAAEIERIEVLTTPPPQYKAEGTAGVINIITRRKRPRGTSGSVQGSAGSGGRYFGAASLNYAGEQGSASLSAGYRHDLRARQVSSMVVGPDPTTGRVLENQTGFSELLRRQVPSLSASGDYTLSNVNSVSGSASWTKRGGLRTYTQNNDSADGAGVVTRSTGRSSSGHDPEDDYDAALRFSHKFSRPEETLDLSAHRSVSHQHEHYDYVNEAFRPPAPTFDSYLDFAEDHGITEVGVDYVLPFSKIRTLKLGLAFERDDYGFRNAGAVADPATGLLAPDPSLTNDFRFHQWIHAGYASYQATVGDWTWLGGLRAEWTEGDAVLLTDGQHSVQRSFEVFPSLHVDHPVTEHATLSFGASRRIKRPDPSDLDPYIDHEYTPNLNAGNPNLRPQLTQSFDMGIEYDRRGGSYQLTGYYRRNRDSVTDVIGYLGNGYALDTKANLPKSNATGLEFSVNGSRSSWLSYSLSGNAFYSQIDASQLGTPGLRSTTGVNLKAKVDVRPTSRDSLQMTVSRTDKRLTAQGTVSAINLVNFGYKRQLKPDLSLVATLSDAFNGQRFVRTLSTATIAQDYRRTVAGRIAYVGVVYSFGADKKDKAAGFEYDQGIQ